MIEISRSLIKQFRAVLRKSVWQHVRKGGLCPVVEFVARPNELTIRSQLNNIAIAYSVPDAYEAEALRVPASALEEFEGRGQSRVSLEAIANDRVLAKWDDAGVPREKAYDLAEAVKPSALPALPTKFTDNDPSLLQALHDAMESTARDGARYAVHNVQLRGTGQVVGTDCHQLLVQAGFQFPWTGEVLLPRVTLFGQDFGALAKVGVAKVDEHVCFRIGAWTIWLPIDKEGRFPKYESIVPQASAATTRLRFSAEDAAYLARTLPHLPSHEEDTPTATLDLNGQVIVRVRSAEKRATEVVLARSSSTGKRVQCSVRRALLARALDLGFTDLHITNDQTPALWTDGDRTFVFMSQSPSEVIAPSPSSIQLRSDAEQSTNQQPRSENPVRQRTQQPEPIAQANQPASQPSGRFQPAPPPTTEPEPKSGGLEALLEEAEALKEQLRDAYTRAHNLINAAKQYRKQARVVNSTLASLRQLQEIAA